MKHILQIFVLFLCTFVAGTARADLVQEWQGKIAQRAETPTTELSDGWYILYNVGRRNCAFDNGSAYKMAEFPAAEAYFSAVEKGGMFFHITAASDGKWHITSALGHNVALSRDTSSQPTSAVEFTIDHIGSSTDVFYILDTNSGYYADGQPTGGNFVGWENKPITSATGNSAYKFYAVSATEAVEVTYHVTATDAQGQSSISWSFNKYENIGTFAGGAALTNAYAYVDNYQCTTADARISATNHEFNFTATHTFPMVPGKKYQVHQTGGNDRYMAAIADDDDDVTLRATRTVDDAKNVWSVVQATNAPYFYLVNEDRGKTIKALRDGTNIMAYYDLGSSQAQAYEFVSGSDGFKLFEPGTNRNMGAHGHLNGGNTSLGAWNTGSRDGNNGTIFIAEEVTPYTLTIEGNADGRIVYNGIEYPDGTTLYFPLGTTPSFTAKAIANFDTVFDSEGPLVKLRYIDMSAPFFNITYRYVDAVSEQLIESVTTSCRYESEFPAPKEFAGKQVLNAPKGTVSDDAEFTILVLTLEGEDQPDPVKPTTVQLTYRFVGPDGTEWHTETVTANNGAAYPEPTVAIPTSVTITLPTGIVNTMQEQLTVDVPCTTAFKAKVADSFENIKSWYQISISASKTLFNYNESDTHMSLTETSSTADKFLFAFVGNPFDGYIIYNKEAGKSKVLSASVPDVNHDKGGNDYIIMRSTPVAEGYNERWDFCVSTANASGYFMARHGETIYANKRSYLAFWTGGQDAGSTVYINETLPSLGSSTTTTTNPTGVTPEHGKVYRIYNKAVAGRMIAEDLTNNGLVKTNTKTIHDGRQMWVLIQKDATNNGFQLINVETGRYIQSAGGSSQGITTTSATTMYLKSTSTGYGICNKTDGSGGNNLNTNASIGTIVGWSWSSNGTDNQGSNWIFEEVDYGQNGEYTLAEIQARIKANSSFSTLESGKYYRLVNKAYPTRYMMEDYTGAGKVWGLPSGSRPNDNCQLWKIVGNASNGYTLQNVFTRHYIKDQGSQSSQFETTDAANSAKSFQVTSSGGSDWAAPQYAFYRSSTDKHSLHNAASQSYWVVSWTYENADASWWNLEPVELTLEEAEAIHQEYLSYLAEQEAVSDLIASTGDYNEALTKVFADAACSEMYEGYKSLSNFRLRQALTAFGLPEEIQEMAVRVKNATWDEEQDETYNEYVRDFRIADYEPYSDRSVWNGNTKVGPFARDVNPTGITVKTGDVLYVYVGDEVKDSDAQLTLEVLSGVNKSGSQSPALHKGLNIYTTPQDGEVFVFYNVTNDQKYVEGAYDLNGVWHDADYPNIRVHIEGGKATGMWDMHRGMDQEDWDYLFEHMLTEDYIHIKGENTIIYGYTDRVRGATDVNKIMKIIDYIFMTEERLIGHDGQWDGRYKPVMLVLDQTSGNPNWGGGSTNLSGIRSNNGEFNYNSLMNERWVYYHEMAHGHQYPINLAATTESSNNGFAQMVNHEFGLTSRRQNGTKTLITFKNNGWGWVDMLRGGEGTSRTEGFEYYGDCVWAQNQMFYQLYLYFHVQGHMPDFYPRLCDWMRQNGGLSKGSTVENPTLYQNDYFKFARGCAEVSQTDLSDFFDTWGFFSYYDDVKVGNDFTKGTAFKENDRDDLGIRFVGDYGHYFLKMPMRSNAEDVANVEDLKTYMKGLPKKAPNIMFIDDHILDRNVSPDCFAATLDPSRVGQPVAFYGGTPRQGDFGDYTQFNDKNEANGLDYSISGNTVTMKGDGLVGVKIYDNQGNLLYIYNTKTFDVKNADVAAKLQDGTYTLVAALGDDTNLPLAGPNATKYAINVYNGSEDNVQHYKATGTVINANVPYTTNAGCDIPALEGNAMMLLPEISSEQAWLDKSIPEALVSANTFYNDGTVENPVWNALYVEFTDKADFYLPEGNYSAGSVVYTRENTGGYNSVCLPFDIVEEAMTDAFGEGTKVYEFSLTVGDRISFIEVQKVEAGKFYIVECPAGAPAWSIEIPETAIIGSPLSEADATGAFRSGPVPDGVYKLNSDGTKFGITKNGKGTVTAFRGYYNPAAPVGAAHAPAAMPLTLVELGDVNGDGTVSVADVTELVDRLNATIAASNRRNAAPAQMTPFERQAQRAADVDFDGRLTQTDMESLISRILKM